MFSASDVPARLNEDDTSSVELGVKFKASSAGKITGIRFYKGSSNKSLHTVHLWSANGALLASADSVGETASGWQQVNLASPVAISANTTYVVSYHTNGYYSETDNYFNVARISGPLTALDSASSGGNSVYTYGTTVQFPTSTFRAANYWVDPVFSVATAYVPPIANSFGGLVAGVNTPLQIQSSTILSHASDPNGYPLSVSAVGSPKNGSVAMNGTVVTFTPATNYTGAASFAYTVKDTAGGTASAVASLSVNALAAPVARNDTGFAITKGSNFSVQSSALLANDTDPNGLSLTLTGVSNPVNGTVSLSGSTITFIPTSGYTGSAGFTYSIQDTAGGKASATVSLTVNATVSNSVSSANRYSQFANYPNDPNFIMIASWLQNPNRPIGGAYATNLDATVASKINTYWDIDNAAGGSWGPTSFGKGDPGGEFAAISKAGLYVIANVNTNAGAGTPNNTDPSSIASILADVGATGAKNVIGWSMGDEPQTGSCSAWPISAIPGQVATLKSYDSTRPTFLNSDEYQVNGSGTCPGNDAYIAAMGVASFDSYPLTSPWNCGTAQCGSPRDAAWLQGWAVNRFMSVRAAGAPFTPFVDTGTDELAFSSQNGSSCSESTNLCTGGQYKRAPAPLVNAEVWMSLINGASGFAYFCQDSNGYSWCLGEGGSAAAKAVQANLTYINTSVLAFAPQINAATVGSCTMINGSSYTSFAKSCSNGVLTMSSSATPGSAMAKSYNGAIYLFAQPAHNGSATMTFTLAGYAGKTATVVYDSNAHYDAGNSAMGRTFALNSSAQFGDSFGANGDNYQVKIYKIQ
ncbi:DUF4082 domain-containing protein [Methylocapsa palsarum]|uniref:DUF4082 domain-containing protein n=1 Tax=Methylocapsa palsarum TaxID=1612308 RepID=UPI0015873D70|nr:DUF4082 domain-containing protein [Methylocapsa palsarum]